jgi:hypothetical protein
LNLFTDSSVCANQNNFHKNSFSVSDVQVASVARKSTARATSSAWPKG